MISNEFLRKIQTPALIPSTQSTVPPPPPQPPTSTAKTTKKSLKKVNWQKLAANSLPKDCFWKKIEDREQYSEDIFDGLDDKFSLPSKKIVDNSMTHKVNLRILETNRAQNLLISLRSQFKSLPHEQIKYHILRCDTSVLESTFIDVLIKCLPEPHGMKQLQEMSKSGVQLLDVEKFISSLGYINRLIPRLHSINFKLKCNDMIEFIEPKMNVGIAACEEVVSSKKFGEILKLILAIGNRLNLGTTIGAAAGFELTVLPKLNDVKSNAENHTLMHFLVETIEKKFPELLDFDKDMLHVDEAAGLNVEAIQETLGKMVESSELLQEALNEAKVYRDNIFIQMMEPFSLETHQKVDILKEQMNRLQDCYRKVGEYYVVNVGKLSMKDFLSTIRTFKESFIKSRTKTIKAAKGKAISIQQRQVHAGMLVIFVALLLLLTSQTCNVSLIYKNFHADAVKILRSVRRPKFYNRNNLNNRSFDEFKCKVKLTRLTDKGL